MSGPSGHGQEQPQQVHLDLQLDEYLDAAERAVGLGATRLVDGPSSVTLARPGRPPVRRCQKDGVGPVMELFAVTIDAPHAAALAGSYAPC
jgi:hypothetical protein